MENYYNFIIFILLFTQSNIKDFLFTSVVFLMSSASVLVVTTLTNYGIDYFDSVIFYEILFLILFTFVTDKKKNMVCVISVCCTSIMYNITMQCNIGTNLYDFLSDNYLLFNCVMFELLILCCISNSKIKDLLIQYYTKIFKHIQKQFDYPERYLGWTGYL